MTNSLLTVSGLSKSFGGLTALKNLDLTLGAADIVGLIGPNGAGKTTAFNVISGATQPSRGSVYFGGRNIGGLPLHKVARLGLTRTFQATTLFSDATVRENVALAASGRLPISRMLFPIPSAKARREWDESLAHADHILARTELAELADTRAGDLAYGDQRRLGVAIALTGQPKLLLLDEPAAGLNMAEALRLADLIRAVNVEFSVAVLIIEHNMKLVMSLCKRIVVLHHGEMIADGTPYEIQADAAVVSAYLGPMS